MDKLCADCDDDNDGVEANAGNGKNIQQNGGNNQRYCGASIPIGEVNLIVLVAFRIFTNNLIPGTFSNSHSLRWIMDYGKEFD